MTSVLPSRYATLVLVLSLLTVGMAVYVSPLVSSTSSTQAASAQALPARAHPHDLYTGVAPTTTSTTAAVGAAPKVKVIVEHELRTQTVAGPRVVVSSTPTPTPTPTPTTTSTSTPPTTTTSTTTTTTTSAKPYVPPTPNATVMAELTDPKLKYYGVANANVPFSSSVFDSLDNEVGKAPSVVEWFDGWDTAFPSSGVQEAWQRGALPIITWESMPSIDPVVAGQSRADDPAYSLSSIIAGDYDQYILAFARALAVTDLPVVIRFDQEMNGSWYPWNEGVNGNTSGQFVQMWKHVWNLFQQVGANQDVIWLWAPNRVDNLGAGAPPLSEYYPGDGYVGWIGLDAYWRTEGESTTFATTFQKSLNQLTAVSTTKPIFLAEVGAIQTGTTGDDLSAEKTAWTGNLFAGILADPRIIGFSWFDNTATNQVDGQLIQDNWQFDSNPSTLQAFQSGVQSPAFSGGVMPGQGG